MNILVKKLEVLKLKDKAFMGRIWEACDQGFTSLKSLHIAETNGSIVIWVASFQALQDSSCATVINFRIETKLAADSANRFQEEMQRLLKRKNMDVTQFKLSIYPLS
ncbi:hypothetical protein SASPL_133584 [Salvia splendens]|uniref:Uncharacterized protein n=1 Tax=Salvia splendens TaxID=180675 RepID=A0A8X8ZIL7_SALSN|nr:hypothetical protein SASPL_133584 [Salvia splendens]